MEADLMYEVLKEFKALENKKMDDFARRHAELLHENEQLRERRNEALRTVEAHRDTIYKLLKEIRRLEDEKL